MQKKPGTNPGQAFINFQPHIHQARFILSEKQTVVAVAGARSGKSLGGTMRFLDLCIRQPGYSRRDRLNGIPYSVAVGMEGYPHLNRVLLPMIMRHTPKQLISAEYHGSLRLLRLHGAYGETHIFFLSCKEAKMWQGLDLYGVWVDEFPLIKEEVYHEIQTRLANQRGWLQLTGTPRGPNWAKRLLFDRYNEGAENLDFFTWKTVDNPFFPKEIIEELRRTQPARYFKRTFEASWDTFEGQVWEDFLEEVHVKPRQHYNIHLPDGRTIGKNGRWNVKIQKVIAGVDWGYEHAGVIVVIGISTSGACYVLDLVYKEHLEVVNRPGMDSWVRRGQEMRAKWGVEMFYCDPSEPEHIKQFRNGKLKALPAKNDVKPGIQTVARYMKVEEGSLQTKFVIMGDLRPLIDEILYYHLREGTEDPEKVNDHSCDALRYALYSYEKVGTFDRELGYVPDRNRSSRHNAARAV
jgi:hypothetical protein